MGAGEGKHPGGKRAGAHEVERRKLGLYGATAPNYVSFFRDDPDFLWRKNKLQIEDS